MEEPGFGVGEIEDYILSNRYGDINRWYSSLRWFAMTCISDMTSLEVPNKIRITDSLSISAMIITQP
jgi:hypothetical protein